MSEDKSQSQGTGVERLLAFSDGVFAIAITLLVLNLVPPNVKTGLLGALGREWTSYLSYLMSFSVIGIVWASHHHMFGTIRRSDPVFLLINVLFLMWVAVVPFPTALLSRYLGTSQDHVAMAIYAATFFVGSILFNLVWWYAVHWAHLTEGPVSKGLVQGTDRSFRIGLVCYLVDFFLAFRFVTASLVLFILLAVFYAVYPLLIGRNQKDRGRDLATIDTSGT